MTKKEILVAEDDDAIREGLTVLLESEGYAVRGVSDGAKAIAEFERRRPDCVLLDVMMPGRDGFSACEELRARDERLPIVFLTARDDDDAQLRGLGLGADDFVSKTASDAVLLARIARAIARVDGGIPPAAGFDFGEWRVDTAAFALVDAAGGRVELSAREIEMLRFFHDHPGEAISRDFLIDRFWGTEAAHDDSAFGSALFRLREKLGATGACLRTLRSRGFVYLPADRADPA